MNMKKLGTKLKQWNSVFCAGMTCKTNVKRDIVVVSVAVLLAGMFLYSNVFLASPKTKKAENLPNVSEDSSGIVAGEKSEKPEMSEKDLSDEVEAAINSVDMAGWQSYRNQYYGFSLEYPKNLSFKVRSASGGSEWIARYEFRKNETGEVPYLGFDVVVYDVSKTKEISNTGEYPGMKSDAPKDEGQCQTIEGHAIDIDDFPAEEIYIPPEDNCYKTALFFSLIRDRYVYNIAPVAREGAILGEDPRTAVNDNFPEFYAAVSTFKLINIVRPKPKPAAPPKPKITAPKPVSYKVVDGKLVCAKKNDKPRKSKQHKKKHLDMECCLDPDEYPNPWCTY